MFKKAERAKVFLKLAITGPSGSGKTYSALRLAKGLGGKTAFIDTENGSASLYSDKFEFDVVDISPPFTTEKYVEAIEFAEREGYTTIVIDSLTHAWSGEGGLLEQKEQLDKRPGANSYTNWATITKKHEAFKSSFLQSKIHVIATMRSKQDYILQEDDRGKKVPKKVGMAPIQRDGMEYEFTTVFDVAMNHEAEPSKDRTGLFKQGTFFKISEDTGKIYLEWLSGAKKTEASKEKNQPEKKQERHAPPSQMFDEHEEIPDFSDAPKPIKNFAPKPERPNESELRTLVMEAKKSSWTIEKIKKWMKDRYNIDDSSELTWEQYADLLSAVKRNEPQRQTKAVKQ